MRTVILTTFSLLVLLTTTAMADTIANRLGFTGRVGFAIPLKDDFINTTTVTDTGTAWNGGLIYGFNDYLASEVDVTYLPKLDAEKNGVKIYEAKITDVALGLQYRILPKSPVVPYLGVGVDFIKGNLKHVNGNSYDLAWTYGGHLNAGLDWFLTKGIALSADMRGVMATDGDITKGSSNIGVYEPFWFQGTFGVRLILPEKW